MHRMAWMVSFGLIGLLIAPSAILTLTSVAKLRKPLADLPANVAWGFGEVFKFSYLEQGAKDVKLACERALRQCSFVPTDAYCPTGVLARPTFGASDMSAAAAKADIVWRFTISLGRVQTVANDKYFGTAGLKPTADSLNAISGEVDKMNSTMPCHVATPLFCRVFKSADNLVNGMAQVEQAIDSFKTSAIIDKFEKRQGLITFMHFLPLFLALSVFLLLIFIWKGGVCYCCGGSPAGFLAAAPCTIFWLLPFVIYVIICVAGCGVKFAGDKIEVSILAGKPTLDKAISHIQGSYPEFWSVAFEDLEDGLDRLLTASIFGAVACLLMALWAVCQCCYRPFRHENKANALEANAAQVARMANPHLTMVTRNPFVSQRA